MKTLFEDDFMKVAAVENGSPDLTLCFTGIGNSIGGLNIQSEEFRKASSFSTAVFVVDKTRSWGNNVDFPRLAEIVSSYGSKNINAIGNSMGGFLAVLVSRFIDVSTVVAICPQYSVSREVVPKEHRWSDHVNNIQVWKYKSLDGCFCERTKYYVLAGVGGHDDKQLKWIPDRSNINKIYFKDKRFNHRVSLALKEDGILYGVVADCLAGKRPSEIIAEKFSRPGYEAFTPR